jgi:hypothetical protein
MSGVRISQLLSAASAQPTDELEINQGFVSRKISVAQIVAGVSGRVTESPNPPASPGRGQLWLNTSFPSASVWQLSLYDGSDWVALGFVDSINNTFESPVPTKNLPMGGFRHTGAANGVARTDYAALGQAQDGAALWGGTATGTANALTISLNPPIAAYAAGQEFRFISGAAANTGAVTLNINSLGAVPINKGNGAVALTAGNLPALSMVTVRHDGTRFRLLDPVDSIAIPDNAVTTAKLADTSVTTGKLAFDGGALSGARNRIINGDMRIDQRYAGTATPNTINGYVVDRWYVQQSVTGKVIAQQNAGAVAPPPGFTNYLGITSQSAYAVLASDFYTIGQIIEGFNVSDLGWGTAAAQPIVISFWVRSSLTGTFGASLRNGLGNRSYRFTYAVSAANTWERKTVSIAGDTTGTWNTTNGIGINLEFSLGVGSTFSGTAGAWAAGNLLSVPGAVSVVGTNGATFYITGVQMEQGTVATPFERRQYGAELALCQRYYERLSGGFLQAAGIGGATVTANWLFKVSKRATPTVTGYSGTVPTVGIDGASTSNTSASALWVDGSAASAEF